VESPPPSDTGRPAIPIRHNQPNTPPSTHYIRPEQVARKIEANGEPRSFYLGSDDGEKVELQRIDAIEITVKVQVHVEQQIPLHHRRLAEINVNYAFGEGTIGGVPALIVATEGEQGGKLTIRPNPKYKKKSKRKKKSAS